MTDWLRSMPHCASHPTTRWLGKRADNWSIVRPRRRHRPRRGRHNVDSSSADFDGVAPENRPKANRRFSLEATMSTNAHRACAFVVTIFLLASAAWAQEAEEIAIPAAKHRTWNVAIVVHDGVELLDFA